MIPNEYTNFVLDELKRLIPLPIMVNSLSLLLNPEAFEAEYNKFKCDTDKYFMHLSNATSEETIRQLTLEMNGCDATKELELISTKVLLAIQEFSKLNETAAANVYRIEKSEWLKYFYHNQGVMSERFW